MEDLALDNGLLQNLDVNLENDESLDVIVEYTFENNKRPLDDTAREEARNDGSESAAKRFADHQLHSQTSANEEEENRI